MRITITKSKNYEFIYISKDIYLRDVRGKKSASNPSGKERTTVTVAKLGRIDQLMDQKGMTREQVIEWARSEARRMTEEEKMLNDKITVDYYPNQRI